MNDFNSRIPIVAREQTTAISKVIAVDMNTGWKDSWFEGIIHYNRRGVKEVANRYFAAIEAFYNKESSSDRS